MAKALTGVRGLPRFSTIPIAVAVYDQVVPSGTYAANTNITLPASGTYIGSELEILVNGVGMAPTIDYNYVGTGTRTQFQMTFNIDTNDELRVRVYTAS